MESKALIEYFCARGHITRVPFSATALFSVPEKWQCEVCFENATRTPPGVTPVGDEPVSPPNPDATRHIDEVNARRSAAQREQILNEALERLRTNSEEPSEKPF